MTRPRESILNLFDPLNLNHPLTPKRIVVSPDSDKENEPGETTVFFNRTYSRQIALAPVHTKPMKRLVDVGDATAVLDEDGIEGLLSVVIEEDEDEMWEEERKATSLNDHTVESTPRQEGLGRISPDDAQTPMQRTPFTDITPEATPIARKKTYRRDEITNVTGSGIDTSPHTTRAPPGSPLASIINAINFSDNKNVHKYAAQEHEDADERDQIPRISVSSASDGTLASSTAGLVPSSSSALLTRTNDPPHLEFNSNLSASTNTLTGSTAHLVPSTASALLTNIPLSHLPLAASISKSDYEPSSPPPRPPSSFASPQKSAYKHSRRGSLIPSPKKPNKLADSAALRPSLMHQNSIDADLQSSFNIHLEHPESSFDLLNDRISFFSGLDNSLNARMDASIVASGMGIGMESSFVGRAPGLGVDMSVIGDFDVKDEEGRMKAFLGMSADWEGKIEAEGTNITRNIPSSVRIVKTAATSTHNTPQPKPKANAKYLPQATPGSAERTPKPPMKVTATVPKKRLSFSLSSTSGPTGAGSPRRLSVVNSPSKAQNSGSTNINTPRHLSAVNSPSRPQNSGLTNTNTPKGLAAVDSPSKAQEVKRTVPRRSLVPTLTPSPKKGACAPSKVAYVAPPPVPALRIIKRSNASTSAKTQPPDRAVSVTGSSTSTSATTGARPPRSSISATRPPPSSMSAQLKPAHKPALQGVQRPRPSIAATVAGPPKTTFGVASKMAKPSKQLSAGSATGTAKSKFGRPTSVVSSSTTTKAVTSVPSRLPTAPVASSTGIRPPSRFGYSGTSSAGGENSALPKPISSVVGAAVSRLPNGGSTRMTSKIGNMGPVTDVSRAGRRRV